MQSCHAAVESKGRHVALFCYCLEEPKAPPSLCVVCHCSPEMNECCSRQATMHGASRVAVALDNDDVSQSGLRPRCLYYPGLRRAHSKVAELPHGSSGLT